MTEKRYRNVETALRIPSGRFQSDAGRECRIDA
jgi:hypothetical protein